jgi:putative resolvase
VNGLCGKLARLVSDPVVTVIVVEHRGRLARFGFEHLQASLVACGRRIVVLEEAETTSDVVGGVSGVLTGWCARWSGRRCGSRRAVRAVAVATGNEPG